VSVVKTLLLIVGQTNVNFFGDQKSKTFLLFFVASSKMLLLKLLHFSEMVSTVMFGNFFPTYDVFY